MGRRRADWLTAGIAAGLLGLVGCGGGTNTSTVTTTAPAGSTTSQVALPSKAEYIAQADDICSTYRPKIAALQSDAETAIRNGEVERAVVSLAHGNDLVYEELGRLEALQVPAGDAGTISSMLGKVRFASDVFKHALGPLRAGDNQQATALFNEAQSETDKARGMAEAYGFKVCGQN